ncbi:hypothetical protein ACFXKW_37245 [Streptomyces sp. NPDC059193]|uniref:hypothetical protein n=1 Tax=Streptomyces sp. NPDC059193 TaxID=3346763 RepID=UPI0036C1EA1D
MSNTPSPGERPPALKTLDHTVAAAPLLQGRVLLHENAVNLPRPRPALDDDFSGVVMTGAKADERAFHLRSTAGYEGTLLIDSAPYTAYIATADEPFMVPTDELFASVDTSLAFQKARGASAALTPTGYIPPADSKTLKAVIREANKIERADTVVTLPIDVTWLNRENIGQLIAVCTKIRHPKALVLFRQFDPLEQTKDIPANLRRLLAEVEHMALLRTDLAALDAVAHGAFCAGIGVQSSLRHAIPPGEKAQTNKAGPTYPNVLMPELMCFKGAVSLARLYSNADPATCSCEECDGRSLDRFYLPDGETRREADNHTVLTWSDWVTEMVGYQPGTSRKSWWRDKCAAAIDRYALENQRIGLGASPRSGFQAPAPLKAWATLPIAS